MDVALRRGVSLFVINLKIRNGTSGNVSPFILNHPANVPKIGELKFSEFLAEVG
jgi:hypothetical protein